MADRPTDLNNGDDEAAESRGSDVKHKSLSDGRKDRQRTHVRLFLGEVPGRHRHGYHDLRSAVVVVGAQARIENKEKKKKRRTAQTRETTKKVAACVARVCPQETSVGGGG